MLRGTSANDRLIGLGGFDRAIGSAGSDFFDGGADYDEIDYSALGTAVTLRPAGTVSKGALGTDTLFQVEGIIGASGRANAIDASSTTTSGVRIETNLGDRFLNVFNIPGIGFRSFYVQNFVNAIGTQGDDYLGGSAANNILDGRGGNDLLFAEEGDDTLIGSSGSDVVNGEAGYDTADYRQISAAITLKPTGVLHKGALGTDELNSIERIVAPTGKTNTIDLSTAGSAIHVDTNLGEKYLNVFNFPGSGFRSFGVENFVNVIGTQNASGDYIEGTAANNLFEGRGGDDALFGNGGRDTLIGGAGSEYIVGGAGSDRLIGSDSASRGRGEVDDLEGGADADRFVLGDRSGAFYKFGGSSDYAQIRDLSSSDRIELSPAEVYRAERVGQGFSLYVVTGGSRDLIGSVNLTSAVTLPQNSFSIASGQTLSVFVGA